MVAHSVRHHLTALVLAVTLRAAVIACAPPPDGSPPSPPTDIALMSDVQVDEALQELAPEVVANFRNNKAILESIPADRMADVNRIVGQLQSESGRQGLIRVLRAEAKTALRGFPPRRESVWDSIIGGTLGMFEQAPVDNSIHGQRTPPPATESGADLEVPAGSAVCGAPDGAGTIPAPANTPSGALLTPQHDVYTAPDAASFGLVAAGQDPVSGGGPGIELRSDGQRAAQQMRVRVHLDDPKNFGPRALFPLINIRPLGGSTATETRAQIVEWHIYCYAGDQDPTRGYFDVWITVPTAEPGFQVIAEVVENDWYFATQGPCPWGTPTGCVIDFGLSPGAAQYFAGGDRSTVHVGPAPVTSAAAIPKSVGAFATTGADPATGVENVLTETNGETSDDVEAAIRAYLSRTVTEKINAGVSGDLAEYYFATVQAWPTSPIRQTVDLRYVEPNDGFGNVTDEPPGATGALRADITAGVDVGFYAQLLGIPCFGISASVDVSVKANVWARSAGNGPGIEVRYRRDSTANADFDMDNWDPTSYLTTCTLLYLLGPPIAESKIEGKIGEGVDAALGEDEDGKPGTVPRMLAGFDLNDYLPTVSLGSTVIKPVVTDIDNAWCTAAGAPAGCSSDQNLLGRNGAEVVADTTMVSTLGDALGLPLGGRFRNAYAPRTFERIEDLTVSHRDMTGTSAGLGVVIDPRLVNLTLRHLAQGSSTNRTTNGILDLTGITLTDGISMGVRPEVAPMVIGAPNANAAGRALAPIALPDLRLQLFTAPNTPPVEFSVSGLVNAGAGFDPSTKKLKPVLDTPMLDIQVTGGCQVDYTTAYAASYLLCGRGTGGSGSPTSLTDLIDYVANFVVLPTLVKSIGGISLPSLDGIVPGTSIALSDVRFNQRGSNLAVYANVRPAPHVAIAISEGESSLPPALRFFPTNLWNVDVVNIPTTFSWEIRDATTNQIVATSPVLGAETSAVRANLDQFVEFDTGLGKAKKAKAKLTLRQADLEITAEDTYTWYPPSLNPTDPCTPPPGGGGFLRAAARPPIAALAAPTLPTPQC